MNKYTDEQDFILSDILEFQVSGHYMRRKNVLHR